MESELKAVIHHLAENRWPFRMHATYDETISRALNVYEEVNREIPFDGLHWFFDHCETISDRNIERIKSLGGGIAVQNRMAFQGEYFVERYGAQQAKRTPPIQRMLEMGAHRGQTRLRVAAQTMGRRTKLRLGRPFPSPRTRLRTARIHPRNLPLPRLRLPHDRQPLQTTPPKFTTASRTPSGEFDNQGYDLESKSRRYGLHGAPLRRVHEEDYARN
jgi:hypothetical protein